VICRYRTSQVPWTLYVNQDEGTFTIRYDGEAVNWSIRFPLNGSDTSAYFSEEYLDWLPEQ
jgi:hypothetical protein